MHFVCTSCKEPSSLVSMPLPVFRVFIIKIGKLGVVLGTRLGAKWCHDHTMATPNTWFPFNIYSPFLNSLIPLTEFLFSEPLLIVPLKYWLLVFLKTGSVLLALPEKELSCLACRDVGVDWKSRGGGARACCCWWLDTLMVDSSSSKSSE